MCCFEAIEADGLVLALNFEGEEFGSTFENFVGAIIGWLQWGTNGVVADENLTKSSVIQDTTTRNTQVD